MHKYLLVSLAIVAFSGGVSSEEIFEGVQSTTLKSKNKDNVGTVVDKLEEKCVGVTSKLEAALVSFQKCMNRTDDSSTICTVFQTAARNCTAPFLQIVDDCWPQKATDLPRLGLKSVFFISLISDYLCTQTGETIFELSNPCVWNEESENTFTNKYCKKQIQDFSDKEENSTQAEICTFVTGLRGCVQKIANDDCKNSKTRSAILGLYDAEVAPCSPINQA